MKRTLLTLGGFLILSWGSIQLWVAGYESGYEEGSSTAWVQARDVLQNPYIANPRGGLTPTSGQLAQNNGI